METRLLHYFVTLAEELHFGRAAQRLCISQPPLSVAIRQLEEQLGAQLFERSSRGVRLTAAGAHLHARASQLLALGRQAAQETRDIAQGTRGHLRLGFVGSSLYRGLPQALAQMQRTHPDVRVDMLEANSAEQLLGLQQLRLDVALVHSIQPPEGIASRLIAAEPFVACLPAGHALEAAPAIDLARLGGERLILFSSLVSPAYHQRIHEMCQAHGFVPEVRHEVRHWLSVLALVSLGQGVALVPAALQRVGLPRLVFRPLLGEHPASEMLAMWRSGPANALVQALLGHLQEAAQALP
ncbi:LysR substrate-binding domain-containing protein [Melaminivora jejuensis]|uniref:LysR family transcriptional regulator n=1 Tax=Melaminivora jejuensis TaxID=1267217 RepID=UPI001E2E7B92|nr:LysR family transcriptional regulator [Melaminivora jejuensis]UHJ63721.1 LysR family transcriptional regulator [Melaminivora jejuensis]